MMCRMKPGTPPARRRARARRVVAAAVGAAVVLAAGTGCAWRLETPPVERRTPAPDVELRDAAALREQAVLDAVGGGPVGRIEAATAPARLAALGGVYEAVSGPTPSRTAETVANAALAARDGALADAAHATDPSLALLLRSIALSLALALVAGTAAGAAPGARIVPDADALGDALVPTSGTSIPADTVAALAVAHDRAAFAYEVAAARAADDDERQVALERSALHRDRAEALVALPAVEDRRAELYEVGPSLVATAADRAAMERELEAALGWDYAALLDGAGAGDAGWLMNAAYDAYVQSASLPGFAEDEVPALPGLRVEG